MRRAAPLLAAVALLGCSNLTEVSGGIVAIEVTVPSSTTIAVGQSVQLTARALNRDGEPVPAEITWATPDTTLAVDEATGLVTGEEPGPGRVQAVSGGFASGLITFTVVAPPAPEEAVRRAP